MPIRIALVFRRRLDLAALTSLLRADNGMEVVASIAAPEGADDLGLDADCDIVILEPLQSAATTVTLAKRMIRLGRAKGAIVLDRDFSVSRARICLQAHGVCYLTRRLAAADLIEAARQLLSGRLVMEVEGRVEVLFSATDAQRRLRRCDATGVLQLSERELQVMKLLSEGMTIEQAGKVLGIAESTVDNHRTRLKAKLKVRRTIDLAHIALREGIASEWVRPAEAKPPADQSPA
ncbi:MAG: response regulator transcription factor [Planctomycetales bacterium]|nr:response regulator transcription factor [Planctomycetales bacterium]